MALFNITDNELKQSAVKFRKDLLMMPTISAKATLDHMSLRPGVAGREVVGQLSGDIELGPYDPKRVDENGVAVTPRVLETFLGSVVKRFDVNEAGKTVYGELYAQGGAHQRQYREGGARVSLRHAGQETQPVHLGR